MSAASRPSVRALVQALVRADLHRYAGRGGAREFWRRFLLNPGFRFTAVLRTCEALRGRRAWYPVYLVLSLWSVRLARIYGLSIPTRTRIGPGFYIGHYGGIVVNPDAVIGRNCNISHLVTIGQSNRGARAGVPTIGDDVYIGPGAKIIGRITIGDGAAIGANAVVLEDVPAGGVAVGVPARVVSTRGSEGYIQHPVPPGGLAAPR